MREISAQQITEAVKRLCIDANCHLSGDIRARIAPQAGTRLAGLLDPARYATRPSPSTRQHTSTRP